MTNKTYNRYCRPYCDLYAASRPKDCEGRSLLVFAPWSESRPPAFTWDVRWPMTLTLPGSMRLRRESRAACTIGTQAAGCRRDTKLGPSQQQDSIWTVRPSTACVAFSAP